MNEASDPFSAALGLLARLRESEQIRARSELLREEVEFELMGQKRHLAWRKRLIDRVDALARRMP